MHNLKRYNYRSGVYFWDTEMNILCLFICHMVHGTIDDVKLLLHCRFTTVCPILSLHWSQGISRYLKGGIGSFLTPVLALWGGSHIDRHVWRWVIVPSDLVWSFGTICTRYGHHVNHRAIIYDNLKSKRERQLSLNKFAWRA